MLNNPTSGRRLVEHLVKKVSVAITLMNIGHFANDCPGSDVFCSTLCPGVLRHQFLSHRKRAFCVQLRIISVKYWIIYVYEWGRNYDVTL